MNYTQYTVATSFGWGNIAEYPPTSVSLVSGISLPDGSSYSFTYEATSGSCTPLTGTYSSNCVTGRINRVTLPTGGTISYIFRGGPGSNNYINTDGTTGALTRTLSPGGVWLYDRSPVGTNLFLTQITDPGSNQTVINFAVDSATTSPTTNYYETQRLVYQGKATGTPLSTTITCYNGNNVGTPSNCYNTAVANPILRATVFKYLPNSNGLQAETDTTLDQFGLTHEVDEYDYGTSKVGALIRKTITAYAALGNGIVDRPSSVTIEDSGNTIKAFTSYGYDAATPTATSGTPQHISITGSRGLLTSVAAQASGTTTLYRNYTYYDTGTLSTSTDVSTSSTTNGAKTTYNYSSTGNADCGNAFVTYITEPLSLNRSMTWDCNGGVLLSLTDESGQTSSTAYSGPAYANYFWRPYSTTDQAGNLTGYFYTLNSSHQPFQTESQSATFNSGKSIVDILTTTDGFGRTIFSQTRQSPTATNYDTVATCYDNSGRTSLTTMPYSTIAIAFGATCPTTNPGNSYTYDALNRTTAITNTGGGSTAFSYNENDVLQTVSSPAQKKQQEYDALGRLTSVCEVTAGTTSWPGASCSPQNTAATGYLTKYGYDVLGNRTSVTQNAQSSTTQTRTYVYDEIGRISSESNPESGTTAYAYDTIAAPGICGGYTGTAGDLLQITKADGSWSCYFHDALHRLTDVGNNNQSTTNSCKRFRYDSSANAYSAPPSGVTFTNLGGRIVEAATDSCATGSDALLTDEWFSYDADGRQTDIYEKTPNSGGYSHSTASYWPNGTQQTLGLFNSAGAALIPAQAYGVEGEGRPSSVTAASGQSPVSSVTYALTGTTEPIGSLTQVTFGSADSDNFQYDINTGKMKQYSFSVNGKSAVGNLTWNTNGSLQKLAITDPFNSQDNQTCTYSHDDIDRLSGASCGSTWSQTFTYDPFGNVTKSGSISWQPNYSGPSNNNPLNNQYQPGWNGVGYDKNGNLLNDTFNTYTWSVYGNPASINGATVTYDALDRMVENHNGGEQFVYSPADAQKLLAYISGQNLGAANIPLPGGAFAIYSSSGLNQYNHPDWLGSARLFSTPTRSAVAAMSYAPFGEGYAGGQQWVQFTRNGSDWTVQDNENQTGSLADFLYRRYNPTQGRWISPDPAGTAAVNPSDPQSWNRYAYVANRPLSNTDPLGLLIPICDPSNPGCGGGGGGSCDPQFGDPFCGGGQCDVIFDPFCNPGGGGSGGPGGGPGGGGGGGGPRRREGGVWANNRTPGLPTGLGNSPFSLVDLLGLSPGTQCGDFISCSLIDQFTNCPCGGDCLCPRLPGLDSIWTTIKADAAVAIALAAALAEELAHTDPCFRGLYACLENPNQPSWNTQYGTKKDCGACFRECKHAGGEWPDYKCPK